MPHIYGIDSTGQPWTDAARKLAEEVAAPLAPEIDRQGRFPSESVHALTEQGFPGLCLPVEFGGQGQTAAVFASVVEEIAHACGSTAMIYVMHVVAAQAIVASTTLSRRAKLLREIARGEHLTTLAFSESGSRSQFWAPMSKLIDNGDDCVISARKSWVTSANHADSFVSSAQSPGNALPAELTLYLLDPKSPGVRIASEFNGLGLRGNDSVPVDIESARVPQGDMLTNHGAGSEMTLGVLLPWFIVGTSAMANGLCRATVDRTTEHLSKHKFENTGSHLRDLPNLRSRLAQMSVLTQQSRALLGFALASMLAGDQQTPVLLMQARTASLSAAVDVTDLAMKTCGGAAFSKQLPIDRLFRDARAGWVMAPTVDHLWDFIGRSLTGMPLFES